MRTTSFDSAAEWSSFEKEDALVEALRGGLVAVIINTLDVAGVIIPQHLRIYARAKFNLSWRYEGIQMKIDQSGITATLSFDKIPFVCVFPWESVMAMESREGPLKKAKFKLRAVR